MKKEQQASKKGITKESTPDNGNGYEQVVSSLLPHTINTNGRESNIVGNGDSNGAKEDKQSLLRERFNELKAGKERLEQTISFGEYLTEVEENQGVCDLSHARVDSMIKSAGVEVDANGKKTYKFFEGEIFGLEGSLEKIAGYFDSSAKRLEVRKRVLLLVGPVGGGKSTIASLLKKGLEKYSKTEEGKAYAIKGCPMNEEPLHLIPQDLRPEFEKMYGVHIEGDLCPQCQLDLEEKNGDYEDFQVERMVFSEKKRKGIGTFLPSDPKSQDISELTGSINFSTIGEFGTESDPRAYKFDGELNKANRGMMEYIEMLKADEKFHYTLLTLTQEQNIKIPRFPLVYADEVIVSHTNENEYNSFINNSKAEALRDRVYPILVPYNLRVSDEKKIYEKLFSSKESKLKIGKDPEKGETHISPLTFDLAASFAVLSRLEEVPENPDVKKIDPVKKMKLYNGEEVEGFSQKDVEDIRKTSEREGMKGISPRYVVNSLSTAFNSDGRVEDSKNTKGRCITPISAFRKLRDGMAESASITADQRKKVEETVLPAVINEFDMKAEKEIQKAFIGGHEDHAKAILDDYVDNVDAFCSKTKIKNSVTGEEIPPNEKSMRAIEDEIGITEVQKKGFREEVMVRMASIQRQEKEFDYKSHPKLREAIEKRLLADYTEIIKTTLAASSRVRNSEQSGRIDKVKEYLVNEQGYCGSCADELIQYVSEIYKNR